MIISHAMMHDLARNSFFANHIDIPAMWVKFLQRYALAADCSDFMMAEFWHVRWRPEDYLNAFLCLHGRIADIYFVVNIMNIYLQFVMVAYSPL